MNYLQNMFMEEYPDFDERAFEVVSGPSLHMLSPRPVTTNIEDFKALMATGKSVWILSDEWMLPLGDKLKDYIEDVLAAKDKIVIPFYCLVRLGKLVRRNQGNNLVRQYAPTPLCQRLIMFSLLKSLAPNSDITLFFGCVQRK